ncbi:hypothetical protein K3495_g12651 [Podosphaera aphanis]|nr:hypothetical protein K3495_g12651 [Podosphaera aphanis]
MPLATYLSTVDPFLSTVYIQQCFLTEQELRQLHRRFGHPTVNRLAKLLERSSHEYDRTLLEKISKFCKFCQKHSNAPGRFKFSLRSIDDVQFNHIVYADIMYFDGSPLLHVVDEGTRFQSAHWLKDMSAKTVWETLRISCIDVYLGPPDTIMHDAGTKFCSSEFKQSAKGMSIQLHQVPTEAHNAVGVVERYHKPLRRAYAIIKEELNVTKDVGLQIAVKAINDTAGPDGIIPTLLVFGAYARMVETDPPAITVSQHAMAIKKAMEEVGKLRAKQQVKAALNQRNSPNADHIHSLPIGSQVLVWREKGGWDGPYTLLAINKETCKIQLANHISEFRATVVKPYLEETEPSHTIDSKNTPEKSSNAENSQPAQEIRRNPDRIRQPPLRFRQSNYFTTPNYPASPNFKESRRKELDGLIQKRVFDIVNISDVTPGSRIFNSRFVDTIKFSGTDRAFEKSRLVVQAYKDKGKQNILTQAPTLQRASQRILLSIAISLPDFGSKYQLYLRDISQAYVQSTTTSNRDLFVKPPPELNLPKNYILKILRPL